MLKDMSMTVPSTVKPERHEYEIFCPNEAEPALAEA
jgi:hypothetical protein